MFYLYDAHGKREKRIAQIKNIVRFRTHQARKCKTADQIRRKQCASDFAHCAHFTHLVFPTIFLFVCFVLIHIEKWADFIVVDCPRTAHLLKRRRKRNKTVRRNKEKEEEEEKHSQKSMRACECYRCTFSKAQVCVSTRRVCTAGRGESGDERYSCKSDTRTIYLFKCHKFKVK